MLLFQFFIKNVTGQISLH